MLSLRSRASILASATRRTRAVFCAAVIALPTEWPEAKWPGRQLQRRIRRGLQKWRSRACHSPANNLHPRGRRNTPVVASPIQGCRFRHCNVRVGRQNLPIEELAPILPVEEPKKLAPYKKIGQLGSLIASSLQTDLLMRGWRHGPDAFKRKLDANLPRPHDVVCYLRRPDCVARVGSEQPKGSLDRPEIFKLMHCRSAN